LKRPPPQKKKKTKSRSFSSYRRDDPESGLDHEPCPHGTRRRVRVLQRQGVVDRDLHGLLLDSQKGFGAAPSTLRRVHRRLPQGLRGEGEPVTGVTQARGLREGPSSHLILLVVVAGVFGREGKSSSSSRSLPARDKRRSRGRSTSSLPLALAALGRGRARLEILGIHREQRSRGGRRGARPRSISFFFSVCQRRQQYPAPRSARKHELPEGLSLAARVLASVERDALDVGVRVPARVDRSVGHRGVLAGGGGPRRQKSDEGGEVWRRRPADRGDNDGRLRGRRRAGRRRGLVLLPGVRVDHRRERRLRITRREGDPGPGELVEAPRRGGRVDEAAAGPEQHALGLGRRGVELDGRGGDGPELSVPADDEFHE
jgi:hypothetical protein